MMLLTLSHAFVLLSFVFEYVLLSFVFEYVLLSFVFEYVMLMWILHAVSAFGPIVTCAVVLSGPQDSEPGLRGCGKDCPSLSPPSGQGHRPHPALLWGHVSGEGSRRIVLVLRSKRFFSTCMKNEYCNDLRFSGQLCGKCYRWTSLRYHSYPLFLWGHMSGGWVYRFWGLYFSLREKCEYCDLCLSGHPLKNITTGPGSDSAPV